MSKFLHTATKAIAIPMVFSEKSQAKNAGNQQFVLFRQCTLSFQKQVSFLTDVYFVVSNCPEFGPV